MQISAYHAGLGGDKMAFKDDFVWGAATAAYQVEGAAYEADKGLNIWDVFSKETDKIFDQQTGEVACEQVHRYKEDVQIMKQLGLKAYRFSINWARILPDGVGPISEAGIQYYNHLIDELIANGIEPYLTLYHWDLPYALHKKGGWLNEESVAWFREYAMVIAQHFSDRVKFYFTFNEPQCFISLGYCEGEHAPGLKYGRREYLQICHNVLKAHGAAVLALREYAKQQIQIGFAPTGSFPFPDTDKIEDVEAARKAMFEDFDTVEGSMWHVAWLSDPVMLGHYPEKALEKFKDYLPKITEEDMALIHQPIDFYGQNIYNGFKVRAGKDGKAERVKRYDGFPKTAIDWPVTPECLYWIPKFLYERYKKPIYIAENGMAATDWVCLDGKVHDSYRIDFYHRYLRELRKAASEGIDIAGYFAWSLMDNFEWCKGYSERFGMIFVDFQTQQRIIKDSGYWYRDVISCNGENLI